MNTITKVIASIALIAVLASPAAARMDSDEGALSAYPTFSAAKARDTLINRTNQH